MRPACRPVCSDYYSQGEQTRRTMKFKRILAEPTIDLRPSVPFATFHRHVYVDYTNMRVLYAVRLLVQVFAYRIGHVS